MRNSPAPHPQSKVVVPVTPRTGPVFYTREELVQLLVRKLLERPFKSRQLRSIAREILGVGIYFIEGRGYVSAVDYEQFVKAGIAGQNE